METGAGGPFLYWFCFAKQGAGGPLDHLRWSHPMGLRPIAQGLRPFGSVEQPPPAVVLPSFGRTTGPTAFGRPGRQTSRPEPGPPVGILGTSPFGRCSGLRRALLRRWASGGTTAPFIAWRRASGGSRRTSSYVGSASVPRACGPNVVGLFPGRRPGRGVAPLWLRQRFVGQPSVGLWVRASGEA